MERQNATARRDQYGQRLNRDHSAVLLTIVPWGSVMLAALLPFFVISASIPLLPPLGLLFLLAWRLVRPGVFPVWAGFPLGFWADLFSGQPFGFSILFFSIALLTIEAMEARFPWRDFWQDWALATVVILAYLILGAMLSGAPFTMTVLKGVLPQTLLSVLAYPVISRFIAALDRLRLMRVRVIE